MHSPESPLRIPTPDSTPHATEFDFDFDDVDACKADQGRDTCRIYIGINVEMGTTDETNYVIDMGKLAKSRDDDDSASSMALSVAAGALGVIALLL